MHWTQLIPVSVECIVIDTQTKLQDFQQDLVVDCVEGNAYARVNMAIGVICCWSIAMRLSLCIFSLYVENSSVAWQNLWEVEDSFLPEVAHFWAEQCTATL